MCVCVCVCVCVTVRIKKNIVILIKTDLVCPFI